MQQAAIFCAGFTSLVLAVWLALAVAGTGSRARALLVDRLAAVTFGLIALTSLCLFRVVVREATRSSGPLPFFVFLGVPLGLFLGWLSMRMASERRLS